MFVTPALAQTSGAGGGDFLTSLLPLILIVIVMYFLLIRPQQKRAKAHRDMVMAIRRGDKVVISGGIFGSVTKVIDDYEIEVEIAKGVIIRAVKHTVSEVRAKPEPTNASKDKRETKAKTTQRQSKSETAAKAKSSSSTGSKRPSKSKTKNETPEKDDENVSETPET